MFFNREAQGVEELKIEIAENDDEEMWDGLSSSLTTKKKRGKRHLSSIGSGWGKKAAIIVGVLAVVLVILIVVPITVVKGKNGGFSGGAAADDDGSHEKNDGDNSSNSSNSSTPEQTTSSSTTATTSSETTATSIEPSPITTSTTSSTTEQTTTTSNPDGGVSTSTTTSANGGDETTAATSTRTTEEETTITTSTTTSTTTSANGGDETTAATSTRTTEEETTTKTTTETPTTEAPETPTCLPFPPHQEREVFDETPPIINLDGLDAEIRFAQAQVIPLRPKPGDKQPRLTALRETLLMLRPATNETFSPCHPVTVTIRNKKGTVVLENATMRTPHQLTRTVYNYDTPLDVDFAVSSDARSVTRNVRNGQNYNVSADEFKDVDVVNVIIRNHMWCERVYLPKDNMTYTDGEPVVNATEKYIVIKASAGWGSRAYYGVNHTRTTDVKKTTMVFRYMQGKWFSQRDYNGNQLLYARNMYSLQLDRSLITMGMKMEFYHNGSKGTPKYSVDVGPPTQLVIHGLDFGLLTQPRGSFVLTKHSSLAREYYQRIPVSRYIATNYAPFSWKEVMIPSGDLVKVLHTPGDVYTGSLRELTTKALIASGIDNANFGSPCSAGGDQSQPYTTAQMTAYNSRVKYSNGIVDHGLSGGGGIVTLLGSWGNEVSHEVGHNYNLPHFPGNFDGSIHRDATQKNSAWAWDSDRDVFLPNFYGDQSYRNRSCCGDARSQPPFYGHEFGSDAMASGSPFSEDNRFTQYTPYSMSNIQKFLEVRAVWEESSPTGYLKYNSRQQEMVPVVNYMPRYDYNKAGTALAAESPERMTLLFKRYKTAMVVYWGNNISLRMCTPGDIANSAGVDVNMLRGNFTRTMLFLVMRTGSITFTNGTVMPLNKTGKMSFYTEGEYWYTSSAFIEPPTKRERPPQHFGVPVVTLLGYYDPKYPSNYPEDGPELPLTSYIFPALYGSFGMTYYNDTNVFPTECHLRVDTRENGLFVVRLAEERLHSRMMNKIHVNIPLSYRPYNASIYCYGDLLAFREIADPDPDVMLPYHVNGKPLDWSRS